MQRFAESRIGSVLRAPRHEDSKYTRGVLGLATGSRAYPGAAVLSALGALHAGIGMVRYVGPAPVAQLLLQTAPEVVIAAADARCDAWVLGSGIGTDDRERLAELDAIVEPGPVAVLDAGALGLAGVVHPASVLTPHAGELARLLGTDVDEVRERPEDAVRRAAADSGRVVLLKGAVTRVVGHGREVEVAAGTPWLATAGTGDVLAGLLGALIAARAAALRDDPALAVDLAAAAAALHGLAGRSAAEGGPFTASALARAVSPHVHAALHGAGLEPHGASLG